jgi:hypothetical protein
MVLSLVDGGLAAVGGDGGGRWSSSSSVRSESSSGASNDSWAPSLSSSSSTERFSSVAMAASTKVEISSPVRTSTVTLSNVNGKSERPDRSLKKVSTRFRNGHDTHRYRHNDALDASKTLKTRLVEPGEISILRVKELETKKKNGEKCPEQLRIRHSAFWVQTQCAFVQRSADVTLKSKVTMSKKKCHE